MSAGITASIYYRYNLDMYLYKLPVDQGEINLNLMQK